MTRRFVAFALRARFVIVAASLALAGVGLYSFWTLDIEAYPDPVQPSLAGCGKSRIRDGFPSES